MISSLAFRDINALYYVTFRIVLPLFRHHKIISDEARLDVHQANFLELVSSVESISFWLLPIRSNALCVCGQTRGFDLETGLTGRTRTENKRLSSWLINDHNSIMRYPDYGSLTATYIRATRYKRRATLFNDVSSRPVRVNNGRLFIAPLIASERQMARAR